MIEYKQIVSNFLRNIPYSEADYQERIVSFIVSLGLGWTNEEINQQLKISLGSSQRVIPDIVIFSGKVPQFLIEVKSAHHVIQEKDSQQLFSYMKQLEVNIGVYFGEKIIVYYKEFGIKTNPINILEVTLDVEDEKWADFFELLHKSRFNIENTYQYLEEVKRKRRNDAIVENYIYQLASENGIEIVHKALFQYFKSENIENSLVESILSSIRLQIDVNKDSKNENISVIKPSENDSYIGRRKHKKRDKAMFSIDNSGRYGCGELALKIVDMISHRPNITFQRIVLLFNTWRENVISIDNLAEWKKKHHQDSKKNSRWFEKDPIVSNDKIKFVVTTQWGIHNIDLIIKVGKELGLKIDRLTT